MKVYPRTDGTNELYMKMKNMVSLYVQVRYDELQSEYDLTDDMVGDHIKDEIDQMVYDILFS